MKTVHVFLLIIALFCLGCGAAPGGNSLTGANGDLGLPLSGATQNNTTSWSLFKDGSYSAAQASFQKTLSGDATAKEKSEAYAGIGWAQVKLGGSSAGVTSFRDALASNTAQADARVGLAGALISKGTRTDIDEAVSLLTGIDSNNANFVYTDKYNVGVSNAEAHAMLAYAYFVQGDRTKSDQQIKIASDLDAQFANTPVDQIASALSFIP